MHDAKIDTTRLIATPEGIELTLHLAGVVPRAIARAIDLAIQLGILVVVSTIAALAGGVGSALAMIAWFLTLWLFPAWCEVNFGGATPGKRALGLAVVRDDGRPVGWGAALTRNLLWVVDFLPFLFGVGLVTVLLSRDSKRVGDLAAGTIVVYASTATTHGSIPAAEPLAPSRTLSVEEQRTVLDFAQRIGGFTAERASELADIPQPLTGGLSGEPAADRLVRIANYLTGRRVGA